MPESVQYYCPRCWGHTRFWRTWRIPIYPDWKWHYLLYDVDYKPPKSDIGLLPQMTYTELKSIWKCDNCGWILLPCVPELASPKYVQLLGMTDIDKLCKWGLTREEAWYEFEYAMAHQGKHWICKVLGWTVKQIRKLI